MSPSCPTARRRPIGKWRITKTKTTSGKIPTRSNYHPPIAELADRPHVCARIPTGGGKTYMAAKTLRILNAYRQGGESVSFAQAPDFVDCAFQCLFANKPRRCCEDRDHPCGNEIRSVFGDNFPILDIADFDNLNVGRINSGFLIVSTAAMFAVRKTTRAMRTTA